MSNQYGEPDWANASPSSTPATDAGSSSAVANTGNWTSTGEDFSANVIAPSNANVAGVSNKAG